MNTEFRRGYYVAMDEVMNYLNTLDTEDKTAEDIKKTIYNFAITSRPKEVKLILPLRPNPNVDAAIEKK